MNLLQSSQNVDEIESNVNLHTAEQKADNPLGIINTLPEGARGLFEASDQLYGTINICMGDFTPHEIDTRIKEKLSTRDFGNINAIITELMSKNDISLIGELFSYMWKANCVLYSVVTAFLLEKGWKNMLLQGALGRVVIRNGEGYMKRKLRILEAKYLSQIQSSSA